eukprot:613077-Hanusia_phi.AAC.1
MADSWDASGSSRTSSAAGEALRGRKKKYKRYKTKFSHSKALKKREALPPPPLDSSMDEQHDGAAAMQERQERQERQGAGGDGSGKETLVNRDCLCTCIRDGKVYRGRILQHQGDRLLVHYLGWNSKHDEWVKQKRVLQIMEQDAKGEVAGRGGKKKVGGPLRFSDPLLFVCYECYEGGKLLSCDACPRRFHRECMGQAQDESAGGGETKDDGWVCSMCATPADRVSFAERVNKLQQACEKFHMKHAAATFGRQFVRVSEVSKEKGEKRREGEDRRRPEGRDRRRREGRDRRRREEEGEERQEEEGGERQEEEGGGETGGCLLYTSPSPRDRTRS